MKKKVIAIFMMMTLSMNLVACSKVGNFGIGNSGNGNAGIGNTGNGNYGIGNNTGKAELLSGEEKTKHNNTTQPYQCSDDFKKNDADFALTLLKHSYAKDENVMVSPTSVMAALSMTANGADGETAQQMYELMAGEMDVEQYHEELSSYLNGLPSSKNAKLSVANSIWVNSDGNMEVKQDFLDQNSETYHAQIYKTQFDQQTLKDINSWVSKNTDHMIDTILDEIPDGVIMYLINAIAFDAKWETTYESGDVFDQAFTTEDGKESQVPMMHSEEHTYLEDDMATGFCKSYKEGYDFVALLPNEGVSVEEYIDSLEPDSFIEMLDHTEDIKVYATLPKFSAEYFIEMSDLLSEAGMPDAFDVKDADFSKMASCDDGNIFINRVLHKTFIDVNENGTKAAAVTAVEMKCEMAMMEEEETRTVTLDRPFVYAIIDQENNLPIFIGTVMEIDK